MLTVLTIEDKLHKGIAGKVLSVLPSDTLRVQIHKGMFHIRYLTYINRSSKVNWAKISRASREGREALLYSGSLPVPDNAGIKVFEPYELRRRLCGNMALAVLDVMKNVPKSLRIGLYDPLGECADLPEHLLRYTDNLIVVTRNYSVYSEEADRLLNDTGAVLCVSPHISLLSSCGLVISPALIDTSFTPMTKAVVLSSHKPSVSLACRVYYRYSFRLEKEWEKLKPEGLDAEVFAGGLYSLCGAYSLGSAVPIVCTGESDTQTTLSLRRYLAECFGT